jgi:lipopolysaccharide export system protein LptA
LGGGVACSSEKEPQGQIEIPDADRESWGTSLALRRASGYSLHVETAYQRYYALEQVTLADSGAAVELRDSLGQTQARISAERMTLEHAQGRASLAGVVRATAIDSLQLESDTLVIELDEERVWGPDSLVVRLPGSESRGHRLRAGLDFGEWSLEEVESRWDEGDERFTVQARLQETSHGDEGIEVRLEGVRVDFAGWILDGPQARYFRQRRSIVFAAGVSGADGERRFRAEYFEYLLDERLALGQGTVELEEAALSVYADTFREDRNVQSWQAEGTPARLSQEGRHLEAEVLFYQRANERLRARGRVLFVEGGRRLQADRLYFEAAQDRLQAGGAVGLESEEWEGAVQADTLVYDLESGQILLEGNPRLVREGADSLEFVAQRIQLELKTQKLSGEGEVRARTAGWEIGAQSATLFYGDENSDGEDRNEDDGEDKSGRKNEDKMVFVGEVVLEQPGHRLTGDSVSVRLLEGKIDQATFPLGLTAQIATADSQQSWFNADEGRLSFGAGVIGQAALNGGVDVTQRRTGRKAVNRFNGNKMDIKFDAEGHLSRLRIEGEAEVHSRLPAGESDGPAGNITRGKIIDITFVAGDMEEIRVVAAEGRYVPAKSSQTGPGPKDTGGTDPSGQSDAEKSKMGNTQQKKGP